MIHLHHQIARLEVRCEQLRLYIQSLDRGSAEARQTRVQLFAMLQHLVGLKDQRKRLESEFGLDAAA
jgi:hypothetical protein